MNVYTYVNVKCFDLKKWTQLYIHTYVFFLLFFNFRRPPKIIEPTSSDVNSTSMAPNNSQLDFEDFCSLYDSFR